MSGNLSYAINLIKMAFPIILGNLGFIMIGVGDVIVAGRHSTETLAAVSLATAITNCLMMFGIGILTSISAILSNYRGKGKNIVKYFLPSLLFTFVVACITSGAIFLSIPLIDRLGLETHLVPIIKDYFFITVFATFGGYLHCMTKEFLQAYEIVIFPNLLTIFCIFINLFFNIVFVFGWGCIPSLGAIGLAIASLITRYIMGIVLFIYCIKKLKLSNSFFKCKYSEIILYYKDIVKVGLPSSLAIMIEFTGFNAISIIMGRVGGIYAAAHNIMCTLTSVSFMIPLAVSNATSVKVGYSNGAKHFSSLKKYAFTSIKICVLFMMFSALILGLLPSFIINLFTNDPELIKICIPIIYVLCFFQIFDGLQVSLSGIFKGLKNTTIVMFTNLVSYWFIAIPLGCLLAFKFRLNLLGFWFSLGITAVFLCSIMYIAMIKKFKKLEK